MAETPAGQVYPGTRFDAVGKNIETLHKMVKEPAFGAFTWHEMFNREMLELNANYFERDFEDDKCK